MSIREKIEKLKLEREAVIIAHNYQPDEVQDLADFTGDSLELSRIAAELERRPLCFAEFTLWQRQRLF